MLDLEELTEIAASERNLSEDEARAAARAMTLPDPTTQAKKDFLLALSTKGETPAEVAAFADTFRDYALDPGVEAWAARAIDVCGTGGDGSGTFNISTAVGFILAALEVPVFKHGNRSITSACGSADLLEALGIQLDADSDRLRGSLEALHFCFFFAPSFHPAFKHVMPVRKELAAAGQRTIFNILGPLINPGRPAHQLLGVFSGRWIDPLAEALDRLQLSAGCVVHGSPVAGQGLDELSCAGSNRIRGVGRLAALDQRLTAASVGLSSCTLEALKGGATAANLKTMQQLLSGDEGAVPDGLRDSVALNAGLALWIVGRSDSIEAGIELALEALRRGTVRAWLGRAEAFYKKG